RTSDRYGLQTLDLVPDRRRAERRQPGGRRLRVGASAAGACRDSRGACGGVRALGAAFAAPSRRERAPRWERTPEPVETLESEGSKPRQGPSETPERPQFLQRPLGRGRGARPLGPQQKARTRKTPPRPENGKA